MKGIKMARSLDDIETRKALSSTAMKAFIGIMGYMDHDH